MSKLKQIALQIPEYLLIASVIFYWGSAGWGVNYIAITLLLILVLQIIFKNRIAGLLIPCILILTCLYMLLALFSEFREFPSFNAEAKQLLFVGLFYFLGTILVSGLMIYKYLLPELTTT
ncbi:hypothetical protein [Owenweeksia hongkongensis]|uniref:hypothetical protein n=1 Tax=Owenweeksia hongkongensis TaxID=253245 RepID=UPI003A93D658